MKYPDEFDDLFTYWRTSPPVNEVVAALLLTDQPAGAAAPSSEAELRAFAAALGAGD